MKSTSGIIFAAIGILAAASIVVAARNGSPEPNPDLASYVNPMIGTGGHGHTFPGAVTPHGMIQPSPDTRIHGWDGCSGYYIADSLINGFSHTHLSGTGCADYGDILLMPTVGRQVLDPQIDTLQNLPYASSFSHLNETASPGYYSVMLDRYGVKAEITATDRVAAHRFTYPDPLPGMPGMIIDLDYSIGGQYNRHMDVKQLSDTEISGSKSTYGWGADQRVNFYARFSSPFKYEVLADSVFSIRDGEMKPRCKALLSFPDLKPGEQLLVNVAISAVSEEGAKANMEAEMPGFDFDTTHMAAREKWNAWLSKIDVADIQESDADDVTKFYTALYHTAIAPNLYSDADGAYLGMDLKPRKAEAGKRMFTVFSTWDTFRALHPLLTIIDPELNDEFLNALLVKAREGGMLPMWELSSNYTGCMIGYHAASMMADAVAKGQNTFDVGEALQASLRAAEYDIVGIKASRWIINHQLMAPAKYYKNMQGWVPADKDNESVAKALEYAYDDWAISQLAKAAGNSEKAAEYAAKGKAYRHYFDPSTRFMRGKMSDGSWRTPFSPNSSSHRADDYCEGTAWQWTWFVPHDVEGLVELMGGRKPFIEKLDSLFTVSSELTGDNLSPDISGLIGQYAHGNEPSHHIAHLYNYVGEPKKTQKLISQIFKEQYRNDYDGLSGNEDCGQMSAWLVMNAMGIYQVAPGNPVYSIGRPLFKDLTVSLPKGKKMHITAPNLSDRNIYVKSVSLNGKPLSEPFISHADFAEGGELEFEMEEF